VPFFKLAGAREALPAKAEQYKGLVREYLRSRGARPDVDSAIEGSFEDLIMVDASGLYLSVECKDTRVSLTDPEFVIPICRYLERYLQAPPSKPFRVALFARAFAKEADVRAVFEKRKPEAVEEFRTSSADAVVSFRKARPHIPISSPREVTPEKWAEFLGCCEVFAADINALEHAIRARGLQVAPWETAAALVGPKNVPKFLEELANPTPVEEQIVSNFFPIISLPDTILCRMKVSGGALFVKKGNGNYFFGAPSGMTDPHPESTFDDLGTIPTSERLEGDDSINWLVELLNEHRDCVRTCRNERPFDECSWMTVAAGEGGGLPTVWPGGSPVQWCPHS